MKFHNNHKTTIFVLIISLLFGQFSFLLAEANESETYYLQSSKVMNENGEWVTGGGGFSCNNGTYNCYAYSIGRFEGRFYNINNDTQYQPGDIYVDRENYSNYTVLDIIRDNVLLDLEALGHTDIQVYEDVNNIPSTINYLTHELICFRVSPTNYHFMKYDNETQSWYHKPNTTAILKYTANNGVLSNDVIWQDI